MTLDFTKLDAAKADLQAQHTAQQQEWQAKVDSALGAVTSLQTQLGLARVRPLTHTVETGDTLSSIAAKHGLVWQDVAAWNGIVSPYTINPGQVLNLFVPEVVPEPEPIRTTVFGTNIETTLAEAKIWYGAVPMVKIFDGGSGVLPKVSSYAKKGQACFKPNQADLGAGRLDVTIGTYIEGQLAAGVDELLITNWQEPNGELKAGTLNLATLHAAQKRLAAVIRSAGVKGKVFHAQTFTADQPRTGVDVPDSWWLTFEQLGFDSVEWARACLDNYANPVGAQNFGGDPYATPYPTTPGSVIDSGYDQVVRLGFGPNYGISEWNASWRKNLPDADHSKRIAYFRSHMTHLMGKTHKPRHVMIWTGDGVQFDQKLYTAEEQAFWAGYVAQSR